jgi:hypothetical protein
VKLLCPIPITPGVIKTGTTIPEPDASVGEQAWTSGGSYSLGDERLYAGYIYTCVQAHSGRTTPPDQDAEYWLRDELRPSNRMAPFDSYVSTPARATTSLTYVLQPGFFNGLAVHGAVGETYSITVRDEPGGVVIASKSGELYEQAIGLYELLFMPLAQITRITMDDIPLSPAAELTVTISAGTGLPVQLGMLQLGAWRDLKGPHRWEGVEHGAEAEPRTKSWIREYDDGTYQIVRRRNATDMRCSVVISAEHADYAIATLRDVLDVPVTCVATDLPRYGYLTVMGLVSGTVRTVDARRSRLSLSIKGFI